MRSAQQPRVVKEISARIQARRRRMRLTQDEMARLLGVSVGTYSHWDNGAHAIQVDDLLRVAALLGVRAGYLLGEMDEAESADQDMLAGYTALPESRRRIVRDTVRRLCEEGAEDGTALPAGRAAARPG